MIKNQNSRFSFIQIFKYFLLSFLIYFFITEKNFLLAMEEEENEIEITNLPIFKLKYLPKFIAFIMIEMLKDEIKTDALADVKILEMLNTLEHFCKQSSKIDAIAKGNFETSLRNKLLEIIKELKFFDRDTQEKINEYLSKISN